MSDPVTTQLKPKCGSCKLADATMRVARATVKLTARNTYQAVGECTACGKKSQRMCSNELAAALGLPRPVKKPRQTKRKHEGEDESLLPVAKESKE